MKLRYFSGFAGIGGFDQGITQVLPEAKCVGYSEVDKYAIKIYEKHFPDRINYGDIRRINAGTLPDFDMFCGGFPCQDLSIAGKRAGLCGARSGLFFEIIRIIREKQPRIVFLENVKGLFSSNGGWDFARILVELDESGYDVEWQCLNSKNFGVPQNRERVFIIGHLRGKPWKPVFPIETEPKTVQETRNGNYLCAGTLSIRNQSGQAQWDGSTTLIATGVNNPSRGMEPRNDNLASTLKPQSGSQCPTVLIQSHHPRCGNPKNGGTGELSSSEYSYSLDSIPHLVKYPELANCVDVDGYLRTGARPRDENDKPQLLPIGYRRIRRLTPLECERLQGYPDGWTEGLSDTQRYKCLGNAVTVNVIDAIVRRMHETEYRPK